MNKTDALNALNAVMRTLDTGITVRGVENAGNLAGCFEIIKKVAIWLDGCDIPEPQEESADAED